MHASICKPYHVNGVPCKKPREASWQSLSRLETSSYMPEKHTYGHTGNGLGFHDIQAPFPSVNIGIQRNCSVQL